MTWVNRLRSGLLDFPVLRRRASRLHTPTQYGYVNGLYVIVDCWNNRILVNSSTNSNVGEWRVLAGFHHPHRIVYSGASYFVADTDNHRIVCLSPELSHANVLDTSVRFNRPHDLLIHNQTLLVTDSQQGGARVLSLALEPGYPLIRETHIAAAYCRSFKLIGSTLYVCDSGGGRVFLLDARTLETLASYGSREPGATIGSLDRKQQKQHPTRMVPNEIIRFRERFFLTNYFYRGTRNRLISFSSLDEWERGHYVDHSHLVKGVPYFMDVPDDRLFLGEIDDCSRCVQIAEEAGELRLMHIIE